MTEFTKEWIEEQREIINDESLTWREYEKRATCHYPEALDHIEQLQKRVEELEATISNQSKLVYKFKNMASDLQSENDFLKNNPEAEKYYYQKWMEGKQRIEELEQERRWTSVDERLPNSSERVLIRMSNYYTVIASYFRNQKCWKNDAGATVHNVTHWQPLPQPPKEVE